MDGIDAAKIIKDRFSIPTVFLTAYADKEKIERAKLVHPYGYLVKPINERDLKISIEMAMFASKANAERRQTEEALQKKTHDLGERVKELDCLYGISELGVLGTFPLEGT